MNTIKNTVQLLGNLGKDVAITEPARLAGGFEGGSKKASVTLATTTYHKNAKGEVVKKTQWHNLIAWGRNAELMAQLLEKGNQVAITGSLSARLYEDKNKVTRTITEIIVDEFMKISKSDSGETNGGEGKAKAKKVKAEKAVPF